MPTPINLNISRAVDENGDAVAGALAYFYASGTTTPITVYADEGQTTPHEWPVEADAEGVFPAVYFEDASFKVTVKDAEGVTLAGYPVESRGGADMMSPEDVEITGGTITDVALVNPTLSGTIAGVTGRLLAIRVFDTTGTGYYDPTPGTQFVVGHLLAAGGGGGNADSDSETNEDAAAATGGGAGEMVIFKDVVAGETAILFQIGAPGAGGATAGDNGANGGDSTWRTGEANELTAKGGRGGNGQQDQGGYWATNGAGVAETDNSAVSSFIASVPGAGTENALSLASGAITGVGGASGSRGANSPYGAGGGGSRVSTNGTSSAGSDGKGYGSGGGGASSMGQATNAIGGDGRGGLLILWEYSA